MNHSIVMAILAGFAVLLAGWGLGRLLAGALPAAIRGVERIALQEALGLGCFALILFLVGQVNFNPKMVVGLTAVLAILGAIMALRDRPWRGLAIANLRHPALLVSLGVVAIFFISGLQPTIGGLGNDGTDYHLLGPQVWLREGIVHPVLDNAFTAMPAVVQILFAPLLAIGGSTAATSFGAYYLLILLGLIWGLARRMNGGVAAAAIATMIFATSMALIKGSNNAFNDIPLAIFILGSFSVALESQALPQFCLAGVLAGFALGAKYHAVLAAPCLAGIVLLDGFQSKKLARQVMNLLALSLVAAAIASPWYLRNWVWFHAPLYPPPLALAKLFPPRYLSIADLQGIESYMHVHADGLGKGPLALLSLPFNVTFRSERFDAGDGVSIAFLAFVPIALLGLSRQRRRRIFAALLGLCLLTWFATAQQARYFTYGFAMLAAFAGLGAETAMAASLSANLLTILILLVSSLYGLTNIARENAGRTLAVFSPARSQRRWLSSTPYIRAFDFLNADPSADRVLILDPNLPPFYLNKPYVKPIGSHGERALEDLGITTVPQAVARINELHVTHIFDTKWPPIEVPTVVDIIGDPTDFRILPSPEFELVFESSDARIYRVKQ